MTLQEWATYWRTRDQEDLAVAEALTARRADMGLAPRPAWLDILTPAPAPVDHMERMNAVADAIGLIATAKLDCYRSHQYGAWECLCRVTTYLNDQHAAAFKANFREVSK